MIYIVCDMNCNNHGNFFRVIGHEREVKEDKTSYRIGNDYYPKGHCYKGKIGEPKNIDGEFGSFPYSQAIDELLPEDYVRWMKTRFKDNTEVRRVDILELRDKLYRNKRHIVAFDIVTKMVEECEVKDD